MNVLFAYGFCGLGGVETAILNRCQALRPLGVTSTVFFREFYGTGARGLTELPHVRVGADLIPSLLRQPFDVICVVDYPHFVTAVREAGHRAALLLETHAALTTRLGAFHACADDPDVAAVIVPSEYNRAHLNKGGRRRAPIYVVPNGVDQDRFRPQSTAELRSRFDTLLDKPVVLWIGRLEDEKNPRGFLRLAMELARSHHDLQFLCIGDAPHDPESYASFAAGIPAGTRDRFTFIRAVPNAEMPKYYSLAGVTGGFLVSTSYFESVPMTFLEAMASGCPVVSTDVGGVREIIDEDVTGLLFQADDLHDAIGTCDRLIGHGASALRTELVSRAAAYVARNHSLEVSGARFAHVVNGIGAAGGR